MVPFSFALQAHWMEAATFRRLADELAPSRRVAVLDKSHGYSDQAETYTRRDYLGDLEHSLRSAAPGANVG